MYLLWIKYLIAGILLTGIVISSAIGIYNVIAFKIPVFGPEIPTNFPEQNTISRPVNFTDIATDDPVRGTLLTEDQAWAHAWAFLQNRIHFIIFLPMEKRSAGLHQVIDDKGNKYLIWEFNAMQKERPFLLFPRYTLGGEIFIDAHDGHILWYDAYS